MEKIPSKSARFLIPFTVDESNNFIYLTVSLVGLLLTGALIDALPRSWASWIMEAASILFLLTAMQSLRIITTRFHWGYLLLGLMFITAGLNQALSVVLLDVFYVLLLLTFFQAAFWSVSQRVLLTGETDINTVIGSLAMYLLLGLSWAAVYMLILYFAPDSISGISRNKWTDNFSDMTYFSFVTITTLGYGDILPITKIVRVLAYLEAITGVFFMAIVVASLIGSAHRKS